MSGGGGGGGGGGRGLEEGGIVVVQVGQVGRQQYHHSILRPSTVFYSFEIALQLLVACQVPIWESSLMPSTTTTTTA